MIDVILMRGLHVLAVVHWIGGVAMIALVTLPAARALPPQDGVRLFLGIEERFALQARISVLLAGVSGLYMLYRLDLWSAFASASHWWLHAMVLTWALFAAVLYVGEPLFLDRWFRSAAASRPAAALALVHRLHLVLLGLSAVTIAGAVLGSRGLFL